MPIRMIDIPPAALLRECFEYWPETGDLVWKVRPREHFRSDAAQRTFNSRYAGRPARVQDSSGYYIVDVNRRTYKVHRLIYSMCYGGIPGGMQVDHINGDRTDNRVGNLRLVCHTLNARNRGLRRDNKTGVNGVSWDAESEKYLACLKVDGRQKKIGRYQTIDAARTAIEKMESYLRGSGYTDTHGKRRSHRSNI